MKRERFFSEGGYYPFIVESNSLMHDESIMLGIEVTQNWLSMRQRKVVHFLDLACGGIPISAIEIMSAFPQVDFHYTGIDINPDQVRQAQNADRYPGNVKTVTIMEGNAWNLVGLDTKFDIVFSGMNFHHGSIDELYSVALQLKQILNPDGFVYSHDEYRPEREVYVRRPEVNPASPFESFRLIDESSLPPHPFLEINGVPFNKDKSDWRSRFIGMISKYLNDRGAKEEYVGQTKEHIFARDFAVSIKEMQLIFAAAGFSSNVLSPKTDHDLSEFFGFLIFERG